MHRAEIAVIAEDRRNKRLNVNAAAAVRDDHQPSQPVVISDVSEAGCRITGAKGFSVGALVRIKFAGELPLRAEIRWVQEDDAGCEFESTLGSDVMSSIKGHNLPRKRLFG
jgi:hypothetical protein